jgi:transcriptional regulator with XRE-family HTH domain
MALQRRKMKREQPRPLGGQKLRELRRRTGLSLMDLAAKLESELGKHIDAAHLNKIETGSIKKPLAETLEPILEGLHASYADRRSVLEAFGYSLPLALPTQREIEEMRRLTVNELQDATYPMLLIDLGHRLLAWNRYTPRLIGRHPDDPTLDSYYGVTTFDLVFNPALGGRLLVENPEEFWPAWLRTMKSDLHVFRYEPWFTAMLAQIRRLPGFSEVWDSVPEGEVRLVTPLSVVPLQLNVPGTGVLQFRLSTSDFLLDPRFHVVHFTPYGATTLRACAAWAEAEGVL